MEVRNLRSRFLSVSGLLVIGFFLTACLLGTNIFLAYSLPMVSPPHWAGVQVQTKAIEHQNDVEEWFSTDNDLLHVVTSRFMQLQPHLLALGQARLNLFETFCLPSMLQQDIKNFVWFIMTDPDLDQILLNRMVDLLSPYPNFYLVLMNHKLVTPSNLTSLVLNRRFATGNLDLLRSLLYDTSRPLLLETRLDADDALHTGTLRKIQETARDLPIDSRGWQVICNNLHYEWRNDEILDGNEIIQSSGQLRLVMETMCITAGYTLVRHREIGSIDFPPWPSIGHHLINRDWPKCMGHDNVTSDCWIRMQKYPAALRSRTVTSAGMNRVQATAADRFYDNRTETLWFYVERDFGISRDEARATSQFFRSNLKEILFENLQGQW